MLGVLAREQIPVLNSHGPGNLRTQRKLYSSAKGAKDVGAGLKPAQLRDLRALRGGLLQVA